jgi:hypothetical protein
LEARRKYGSRGWKHLCRALELEEVLSEEWSHHPTCLSFLFHLLFLSNLHVRRAMWALSIKYSLRRQWRVTELHAQHSNKWSFKRCYNASDAYARQREPECLCFISYSYNFAKIQTQEQKKKKRTNKEKGLEKGNVKNTGCGAWVVKYNSTWGRNKIVEEQNRIPVGNQYETHRQFNEKSFNSL